MSGRKRLAEGWQSFEHAVMPRNASKVQREEMEKAFYAGAASLLRAVLTGLIGGDETTPDDLRVMEELEAELQEFPAKVIQAANRGKVQPPS